MKKSGLLKNQIIKNIIFAILVVVFGFILLNIAFIFDFLLQNIIDFIIKLFTPVNANMDWYWYPLLKHVLFLVIIGFISFFIFRSKLGVLYKAIYMTVPLAVVFVTIGMFLYRWPIVVYSLGGLFSLGVLYYFYRTKQPWLYYYTLILISFAMLLVVLFGIEI